MKTLVCHPDNALVIQRRVMEQRHRDEVMHGFAGLGGSFGAALSIRTNENMERERWTGRWVLPSGRAVEPERVHLASRFVEYGPEDVEYLELRGVIRKEMELAFYLVDDFQFRVRMFSNSQGPREASFTCLGGEGC